MARKRDVLVEWREHIRLQEPVVTDLWWLPAVLAPYAVEHPIYVVAYEDGVSTWLDVAVPAGVDAFTYASMRPVEPAVNRSNARLERHGEETILDLNISSFQIVR